MRVLIVGCGYVGFPLGVDLVAQGHEVFGLRRNAASEAEMLSAGIKPLFADITRPDELKKLPRGFDWVVNCVAAGGADYREVYLTGTKNLLAWLAPNPPKKFIYTSSTSVYAQDDGSQVKESSPTEPANENSKVLSETEKVLLAASHGSSGLSPHQKFPAVILRVAGIYGPERGHLFYQFLKGEAQLDGDGTRILNMIHRDDVVGSIIAALKSGRAGEIYNAVDDEPVSQFTFFQWLAGTLGKDLPSRGPENPEARKRGATNKRVQNRKLKMELGYVFKHPNFRIGYSAELLRLDRSGKLET